MENKFKMTLEHNVMYAKRNIIDTIYSEAKLEGISVTYPDTQEIYEGRTVAGLTIEETIKVNNLKHAWNFILENVDYPIDLRFIKQVNQEVGENVVINSGSLRQIDVKIGGTVWKPAIPNEEVCKEEISVITNDSTLSATDKAIRMMLYVMRGQLFMDGNKRTAQLVANKIMIENGVGIISIPVNRQKEFVTMLIDYYETGNLELISKFVYEYCIDGFNSCDL